MVMYSPRSSTMRNAVGVAVRRQAKVVAFLHPTWVASSRSASRLGRAAAAEQRIVPS